MRKILRLFKTTTFSVTPTCFEQRLRLQEVIIIIIIIIFTYCNWVVLHVNKT